MMSHLSRSCRFPCVLLPWRSEDVAPATAATAKGIAYQPRPEGPVDPYNRQWWSDVCVVARHLCCVAPLGYSLLSCTQALAGRPCVTDQVGCARL